MSQLFIDPFIAKYDTNGEPISGAKLYFYEAGTSTPLAVYSDKDLTTPLTNPVVADSDGRFTTIWMQNDSYKVILKDASDVTIKTVDDLDFTNQAVFDSIKQQATTVYQGVVELATDSETVTGTDTERAVTPSGVAAAIANQGLPRLYKSGLNISNGTDADHDINISVGECRDISDSFDVRLGSVFTKQIDANWAEGTDSGGFPSGLVLGSSTWYHVFIISKIDGTVDAGFDTSLTATNLLADATGYTKYRRIGSVKTDGSSNIIKFTQRKDRFYWYAPITDRTSLSAGAAWTDLVLSVPTGVSPCAIMHLTVVAEISVSVGDVIYYALMSIRENDNTNTYTTISSNGACSNAINAGRASRNDMHIEIYVDSASKIEFKEDFLYANTISFNYVTLGWIDSFGE